MLSSRSTLLASSELFSSIYLPLLPALAAASCTTEDTKYYYYMYNLESWAYFEGKAATKATTAAAKTESQTEAVASAAAAATAAIQAATLWQNEGHNSLWPYLHYKGRFWTWSRPRAAWDRRQALVLLAYLDLNCFPGAWRWPCAGWWARALAPPLVDLDATWGRLMCNLSVPMFRNPEKDYLRLDFIASLLIQISYTWGEVVGSKLEVAMVCCLGSLWWRPPRPKELCLNHGKEILRRDCGAVFSLFDGEVEAMSTASTASNRGHKCLFSCTALFYLFLST